MSVDNRKLPLSPRLPEQSGSRILALLGEGNVDVICQPFQTNPDKYEFLIPLLGKDNVCKPFEAHADKYKFLLDLLSKDNVCKPFETNPPYLCEQPYDVAPSISLAWANTQLVYSVVSSMIATVFYRLRSKKKNANSEELHGVAVDGNRRDTKRRGTNFVAGPSTKS